MQIVKKYYNGRDRARYGATSSSSKKGLAEATTRLRGSWDRQFADKTGDGHKRSTGTLQDEETMKRIEEFYKLKEN